MMQDLTMAELDTEAAELVPAREALALFNFAFVEAYNTSLAANVLTVDSTATSYAGQAIVVEQS